MQLIEIGGRLAGDAELNFTPNGQAFLKFTVVCNSRVKSDGQWSDQATYYRCVYWGGQRCEGLKKLMLKGAVVTAAGELEVRMYNRGDGSPAVSMDVRASHVWPLMTPRAEGGQPRQQYQQRQPQQQQQPDPWGGDAGGTGGTSDDDIPF